MKKTRNELLHKLYSTPNQLGQDDRSWLFRFFNSEKGINEWEDQMNNAWKEQTKKSGSEANSGKIWNSIQVQIKERQHKSEKRRLRLRLLQYASAAAILFAVLFSFFQYYTIEPIEEQLATRLYRYECPPGKVQTVKLPDGSQVRLFPGSMLYVPESFENQNLREATLTGEAFFEIEKNPQKPFIVKTGDIGIKVLGTSFNVANHPSSKLVEVVLKTGKVSLVETGSAGQKEQKLQVGQKAIHHKGRSGFTIQQVDTDEYTSWLNGSLKFVDEPMENVLHKLGQWYNVKFVVEDSSIYEDIYTATIATEPLESILDLLEFTASVETIIVSDKDERTVIQIKKRN